MATEHLDRSICRTADPDALPTSAGAYLLFILIDENVALPPRFGKLMLPKGRFIYAGNANGKGGIRARCRRHLRPKGVRHWHVDWLTSAASKVRAAAFPGRTECELIDFLSDLPDADFPIPGFGSSDCRRCQSHLIQVDSLEASSIWPCLSNPITC
ncbi:MAG: GIY-YIG nuclease family protein [Geminicoccaceae bacterium]